MRETRVEMRGWHGRGLLASRVTSLVSGASGRVRERGVALISALLLVALATTAAVAMASRQQIDIRRTTNTLEYDQALLYVQGVEDWAGQILKRDLKDGNTDSLDEAWATVLPPIPVEGGQIAGAMEDMQARFNLNSLITADGKPNQAAVDRFRRLLSALQLPGELADTLLDWLDADDDVSMGGAEQIEYLSLQPPYRAFNGPMASPSELWLIKGMTREIYATLAPYVATLPPGTEFNVSTVSAKKPALIMCLADNIGQAEAVQVLENRGDAGFTSPQDFTQDPLLASYAIAPEGLTVKSDYFMVTSHVQVGRSTFTTYSLLKRSASGTHTVMRAQGIY